MVVHSRYKACRVARNVGPVFGLSHISRYEIWQLRNLVCQHLLRLNGALSHISTPLFMFSSYLDTTFYIFFGSRREREKIKNTFFLYFLQRERTKKNKKNFRETEEREPKKKNEKVVSL